MLRGLRALLALYALLLSLHARAAPVTAAAERARNLANRLQTALDPDQQGRVTMAVGILDNGKIIVATSEKDNRPRSPIRSIVEAEGADWVADVPQDHAEIKIIRYVESSLLLRHRKILVIAAGRPICEECELAILRAGARPASPCKSGRSY